MGQGDLREADAGRDLPDAPLVQGERVGVHQHDRDGAQSRVVGCAQVALDRGLVQRLEDFQRLAGVPLHARPGRPIAVSVQQRAARTGAAAVRLGQDDALVRFDHARIQQLRQVDAQIEDARPVLVADPQDIPEPLGDDENRRLPLALQQGIGRHRRAHADPLDAAAVEPVLGDGLPRDLLDDAAHPFAGRIRVVPGVVRQKLQGHVTGRRRDLGIDVGKRAAPVNGEAELGQVNHGRIGIRVPRLNSAGLPAPRPMLERAAARLRHLTLAVEALTTGPGRPKSPNKP